jgi:hypothetical protein
MSPLPGYTTAPRHRASSELRSDVRERWRGARTILCQSGDFPEILGERFLPPEYAIVVSSAISVMGLASKTR